MIFIVPGSLYREIGYQIYEKFLQSKINPNIILLIEKEKRYFMNRDKELKKEDDKLAKKLGGFIFRF